MWHRTVLLAYEHEDYAPRSAGCNIRLKKFFFRHGCLVLLAKSSEIAVVEHHGRGGMSQAPSVHRREMLHDILIFMIVTD